MGADPSGHFDVVFSGDEVQKRHAISTESNPKPDNSTSGGDKPLATNGGDAVAISGYDPVSLADSSSKKELPENVKQFPMIVGGGLFGLAKNAIVWRRPKRKTKPGKPKIAADGYEWRSAPTGDGWVLWHRPYLPTGKRGKSEYAAYFAAKTVKQLEKQYGSRSTSKRPARLGRMDSGRDPDSDTRRRAANFG